jgi:hypothetical protein
MTRLSVDGPHHGQQAIHLHLHLQAAGQPTSSCQNPVSDFKVRVILELVLISVLYQGCLCILSQLILFSALRDILSRFECAGLASG